MNTQKNGKKSTLKAQKLHKIKYKKKTRNSNYTKVQVQ